MHNNIAETTQPSGNVVNVIPEHDFWKPYDGGLVSRSAWIARNDKEKKAAIIAIIYNAMWKVEDEKKQIDIDAFNTFIFELWLEIEIWCGFARKKVSIIKKNKTIEKIVPDEEVIHMLDVLDKNMIHLKKKLEAFSITKKSGRKTSADAVISTFSTKDKQKIT